MPFFKFCSKKSAPIATYVFTDKRNQTCVVKLYNTYYDNLKRDKKATFSFKESDFVHTGFWRSDKKNPNSGTIVCIQESHTPEIFYQYNKPSVIVFAYLTDTYIYKNEKEYFANNQEYRLLLNKIDHRQADYATNLLANDEPRIEKNTLAISIRDCSCINNLILSNFIDDCFNTKSTIHLIESGKNYTENMKHDLAKDMIRILSTQQQ